ncbi:hypothetical protein N0V84_002556 [Fusarium piperis]|uniref:Uncharacterized protein n=1 Tax=Fusarium piperis TaxID=1435070 RepID=A0A9W8WJ16_9HYPO|nr:hypothetical protein N0V84_002556 [Fusarium piperis]
MNTISSGTEFIRDCVRLVNEAMPTMYTLHANYPIIEVSANGGIVLSDTKIPNVNLWAFSLTGSDVSVNMSLQGIQRTLRELAESGAPWADFQAVRYQFMSTECISTIVEPAMLESTIPNLISFPSGISAEDWLKQFPSTQK